MIKLQSKGNDYWGRFWRFDMPLQSGIAIRIHSKEFSTPYIKFSLLNQIVNSTYIALSFLNFELVWISKVEWQ